MEYTSIMGGYDNSTGYGKLDKIMLTRMERFFLFYIVSSILITLMVYASPPTKLAEETDIVDEELKFADELVKAGLPDYAQIILDRFKDDPSVEVRKRRLEIDAFGARGKFSEAEALIAKMPSTHVEEIWGMKLALADWYYAWGKYAQASALYEGFLKQYSKGPPDALKKFYISSTYKYAQMLILMNKIPEAIASYDKALLAIPQEDEKNKHIRRQMLGEKVDLMMKLAEKLDSNARAKLFKTIEEIIGELYMGEDIWLGKAIVVDAHMKMMLGNIDEAMSTLDNYKRVLEQIDINLQELEKKTGEPLTKLSPMAEARYLLGKIFHEESLKILEKGDRQKAIIYLVGRNLSGGKRSSGAFQHFLNVFIRYPFTPWAPDAGIRLEKVKEILTSLNIEVEYKADPKQMEKVKSAQFSEARAIYNQQQFEQAIDAYIKVLALFPEGETEILALGDLARSYIEIGLTKQQDDPEKEMYELHADTVIRYISERFCQNNNLLVKAGDEVLRIAQDYADRNMLSRRDTVYDVFLSNFDKHPRTPAILYKVGQDLYEKNDYQQALKYFMQIVSNYQDSAILPAAMSQSATCYAKLQDYSNQVAILTSLINRLGKEEKPGPLLLSTKFQLGYAYLQMAKPVEKTQPSDPKLLITALKEFSAIEKTIIGLPEKDGKYQNTPEEVTANQKTLERALLFKAIACTMITEPEKQIEQFRKIAIITLESLLNKFPKSEFAPKALIQLGMIYTLMGDVKQAEQALSRLQASFPDSIEAKQALPQLGFALLEQGRRSDAINVFSKMFEKGSTAKYAPLDIYKAASELEDAGEHAIAIEGFEKVLADTKDLALRERALLGKGKALLGAGKYEDAVKTLEEVSTKYKSSTSVVDALINLSKAYAELANRERDADKRRELFNKSVIAMNKVKPYDKTPEGIAKVTMAIAKIYILKAQAEETYGVKDKAAEAIGTAVVALLNQTMDNPNNPKISSYIEESYYQCIPLLIKLGRTKEAFERSAMYMKDFPIGKYLSDIRNWNNEARMKLITEGMSPEALESLLKSPEEKLEKKEVSTNAISSNVSSPEISKSPKDEKTGE